jgi:hypothetical protein
VARASSPFINYKNKPPPIFSSADLDVIAESISNLQSNRTSYGGPASFVTGASDFGMSEIQIYSRDDHSPDQLRVERSLTVHSDHDGVGPLCAEASHLRVERAEDDSSPLGFSSADLDALAERLGLISNPPSSRTTYGDPASFFTGSSHFGISEIQMHYCDDHPPDQFKRLSTVHSHDHDGDGLFLSGFGFGVEEFQVCCSHPQT